MDKWGKIIAEIGKMSGQTLTLTKAHKLASNGCINETTLLTCESSIFFVKHNNASHLDMFAAEAAGLEALEAANALRVPAPICWGVHEEMSFLALEFLEMAQPTARSQEKLGQGLAALHRITQPQFGWHRDNAIGSTPQCNMYSESWLDFFRERRLRFQFKLATQNGYRQLAEKGERLLEKLEYFFVDHARQPSLLHGDLWQGNVGATRTGEPVIFDPAIYFGDRETDIAMTKLFGGFSDSFYSAYCREWPLSKGFETRQLIYNLYHLLNHLNLFGQSYLSQTENTVDRLIAETN